MDAIWTRVQLLAEALRRRIAAIPGATVTDIGSVRGGIVTFTMAGRQSADVRDALAERRINVTVTETPSTRLDMENRGLSSMVRASVHYYNSEAEVDEFCSSLERLAAQ